MGTGTAVIAGARRTAARIHPSVPFVAGVAWDWGTLRVDSWIDNGLLCLYLSVLVGIFVLELRREGGRPVPGWAARNPDRLRMAEQFFLGALLSAFWVHVVRALYPGPAAVFATGLVALAIANESSFGALRASLARAVLVTFCSFQLASLILPQLTGELVWIGIPLAAALVVCAAMLLAAHSGGAPAEPSDRVSEIWAPIAASMFCAMGLLAAIRLGLVPPLPLVLREGTLAREVGWQQGELQVDPYPMGWLAHNGLITPVVAPDNDGISLVTAIYAPAGMDLQLLHEWQWLDPQEGSWNTSDRIPLEVEGGASWRTWSTKRNVRPGRWRVRVLTEYGQELGRVRFSVPEP